VNAAHAFVAPPALPLPMDGRDAAVAAMLRSLQSRLDAQQLRIAGLEAQLAVLDASVQITKAAPAVLVPFERRLFPWIGRLAQAVADEWGVSAAELTSQRRQGLLIKPRFVLVWAVKQASDYSLPQIGRLLNRDHTTVMHACRRVNEWRATDEVFRHVTDQLAVIGQRLRSEQLHSLRARQDELIAEAGAEGGVE
jgi:hypothetical protein